MKQERKLTVTVRAGAGTVPVVEAWPSVGSEQMCSVTLVDGAQITGLISDVERMLDNALDHVTALKAGTKPRPSIGELRRRAALGDEDAEACLEAHADGVRPS